MAYEAIKLDEGFWAIQDGMVRMYLTDAGDKALLNDTGYGTGDLKGFIEDLLPGREIEVINTHCHPDHISGNGAFHTFYMTQADHEAIRDSCPEDAVIHIIADGDTIRAGEIELTVIDNAGHTPGCIALLDKKHRRLFSADSIAKNFPVYMQYPGQDIRKYNESLRKLRGLKMLYDKIYPCHGELHIDFTDMDKAIACSDGILDGSIEAGVAVNSEGQEERAYRRDGFSIFH